MYLLIRTLNPDGSEQRVIYGTPADLTNPNQFAPTPWEAFTYDANDLAPISKRPDGASLANAAPATHHFTPSSIVIDALDGEAISHDGFAASAGEVFVSLTYMSVKCSPIGAIR
jgi:hypothetical protein